MVREAAIKYIFEPAQLNLKVKYLRHSTFGSINDAREMYLLRPIFWLKQLLIATKSRY